MRPAPVAVHRDRRPGGQRQAGATPWQVRRIAALETGLACLLGSAVATVFSVLLLLRRWDRPTVLAWVGTALVAVAVPALGAVAGALAPRRVVASPLGWVRRVGQRHGRGPGLLFLAGILLVAVMALLAVATTSTPAARFSAPPSYYLTGLDLTGAATGIAFAITLSGLAVGTAESLATRRRSLAAQAAAGVPQRVLDRPLLLETALPLAPGAARRSGRDGHRPLVRPGRQPAGPLGDHPGARRRLRRLPAVAAATALPLLRRSVRPGELRYA